MSMSRNLSNNKHLEDNRAGSAVLHPKRCYLMNSIVFQQFAWTFSSCQIKKTAVLDLDRDPFCVMISYHHLIFKKYSPVAVIFICNLMYIYLENFNKSTSTLAIVIRRILARMNIIWYSDVTPKGGKIQTINYAANICGKIFLFRL